MLRAYGALALLIASLLAATASPAAAVDHPVSFPVAVETGPYTPSALEVGIGDTVTFTGEFSYHPLAWTDGDFATLSGGGTASYLFTRAGTFRYFCTLHVDMLGSVRVPGNQLPVADFTVVPASTVAGATVTFDAGAVADPDGTIKRYEWDLDGNGVFETIGSAAAVATEYERAGTFNAGLRVVDDSHETSATTVHQIVVAPRPGTSGVAESGAVTSGPAAGAGGAGDTAATGSTSTKTTDRRAPVARLTTASSRTIRLASRTARLGLRLDEAATVSASLRQGRGRTVLGRGRALMKSGTGALRLTLTRAGLRVVKPQRRTKLVVILTATDAAGNARTVRRGISLTR